ncbi:DUF3899 domain-containing protein [Paraliobacillus sp. JSM ZJ581]|uniref:DUF3899 domain-containing protein n=1 Tax=Paraliobacillus sp. JSM ZJ581 TaxID=3342118 RepID=UPI0035A8A570
MPALVKCKTQFIILLINFFLTIVIAVIVHKNVALLYLINILFYFDILYLLLWLMFITIKGGFFDGVTYGFRKAGGSIFRKNSTVEWEEKPLPSKRIDTKFIPLFRFQAICLTFTILILLAFYYL